MMKSRIDKSIVGSNLRENDLLEWKFIGEIVKLIPTKGRDLTKATGKALRCYNIK